MNRMSPARAVLGATLLAAAGGASAAACPALPDTMRAIQLAAYGGPDQLVAATIARPDPAPGEVLVDVAYTSVNPIDWKLREGLAKWWPLELPAILGRDASGVVAAVGAGVTQFACGDAVVVYVAGGSRGGYAEYVATATRNVARKPANLSWAEAAAFPLVAMTAWQAVVATGKAAPGDRVLVHGGAGGVGSLAVQLAKWRGAHVTTTASARNHDYVKGIGADVAIDYRTTPFESVARDMDLVVDTVGGDTLARSPVVLKRGGRLVTIAGRLPADACAAADLRCDGVQTGPDGAALQRLADLFADGTLRVNVDAEFPLAKAGEAQELNRQGHTRGKIVLKVDAAEPAAP